MKVKFIHYNITSHHVICHLSCIRTVKWTCLTTYFISRFGILAKNFACKLSQDLSCRKLRNKYLLGFSFCQSQQNTIVIHINAKLLSPVSSVCTHRTVKSPFQKTNKLVMVSGRAKYYAFRRHSYNCTTLQLLSLRISWHHRLFVMRSSSDVDVLKSVD